MAFRLRPFVSVPQNIREWTRWIVEALQGLLSSDNDWTGKQSFAAPPILPTYTVAAVPSAATYARGLIYVSNESGGGVVAFSDGTNWRRVTDRAVIS